MKQNFCNALENGNAEKVESIFTDYMKKTISVRDTFVKKQQKKTFTMEFYLEFRDLNRVGE